MNSRPWLLKLDLVASDLYAFFTTYGLWSSTSSVRACPRILKQLFIIIFLLRINAKSAVEVSWGFQCNDESAAKL